MGRRRILFGAAAFIALPVVSGAQVRPVPSIGFLGAGTPSTRAHLLAAFGRGLKEGGLSEGQDVRIEYRWAEGSRDRLQPLAEELVRRGARVIVAAGGSESALAARRATQSIPTVFIIGGDPVRLGLVNSLSRPGTNATGITNTGASLDPKRFELLQELLPGLPSFGYLVNPENAVTHDYLPQALAAAQALGRKLQVVRARNDVELETAFVTLERTGCRALVAAPDVFFLQRRERLAGLAARYRVAVVYPLPEFALAGGLMSYGADSTDIYRQAGVYAARILKGAKPADLPVIQASKLELVFNLGAAKKIGLNVPRDFLARVDRVVD